MFAKFSIALLVPVAAGLTFATPAAAEVPHRTISTQAQFCPGLICRPFFKTDRTLVEKRAQFIQKAP
ncbi:hypothetical protein [Cryptosporangium phraense]|uniref:Uncharacterized protein n=1 Tax=Cryptosporangium phraense TaxID=2593070 RepID=A0A545AR30_9ACTN|nr:hypothetical protein [Cryptosporangium phraense]TQS43786.1 hypothetical protein FL583_17280 [Cryptosporangium phraense]